MAFSLIQSHHRISDNFQPSCLASSFQYHINSYRAAKERMNKSPKSHQSCIFLYLGQRPPLLTDCNRLFRQCRRIALCSQHLVHPHNIGQREEHGVVHRRNASEASILSDGATLCVENLIFRLKIQQFLYYEFRGINGRLFHTVAL